MSSTEAQLKLCISSEQDEKQKLEEMKATVTSQEIAIAEKSETVSQLKKRIPATQDILKNARRELDVVKREQVQLSGAVHKNRASLEEARSSMQASSSRGKVVDALMNEKKMGRCPGVLGRLVRM